MAITYQVPGPCTLSFKGNGLGYTKAGIFIRPAGIWNPMLDDEHGTEPSDFIYAGKGCIVETVLVDMTSLGAASATIGEPFQFGIAGSNLVGRLIYSGQDGAGTDLGGTLTITEPAPGSQVWTALQAVMSDPSELILSSVQENQVAVAFTIVPDVNGELFSVLPNYMAV